MSLLRATLEADLFGGRRTSAFPLRLLGLLLFGRSGGLLARLRLAEFFARHHLRFLAARCIAAIERRYCCYVSSGARIEPGLKLPHPVGVVIGEGAIVGRRCTIYQDVTIGGRKIGDWRQGRYPTIGDDVVLFAGARILGAITIGDRCTIGANAVVLADVPPGATAVGAPARIVQGEASLETPDGEVTSAKKTVGVRGA